LRKLVTHRLAQARSQSARHEPSPILR
jgi:hypothetical protein